MSGGRALLALALAESSKVAPRALLEFVGHRKVLSVRDVLGGVSEQFAHFADAQSHHGARRFELFGPEPKGNVFERVA